MSTQLNNQQTITELSEEDLSVVNGGSHHCHDHNKKGKKAKKDKHYSHKYSSYDYGYESSYYYEGGSY
jgi:hypothetical protein